MAHVGSSFQVTSLAIFCMLHEGIFLNIIGYWIGRSHATVVVQLLAFFKCGVKQVYFTSGCLSIFLHHNCVIGDTNHYTLELVLYW